MNGTRIVIADDHSLTRKGIRSVLEDYPEYEIVGEAGDGPTLMNTLEKTRPDCVLIDLTMPNFDPIPTIQTFRERYPLLRILIISAHDDDAYVQGLLRVGVNGYHLKGEPLSDFRLAIEKVMQGGMWLSSPLMYRLVDRTVKRNNTISLTSRQMDLLKQLQNGLDNKSIAIELGISIKTVENNLTRLYHVLDVQSRLEAVNYANNHPELFLGIKENEYILEKVSKASKKKPATILLIDDNPNFRKELRHSVWLASKNSQVYDAENIEETLHYVQNTDLKLVFVDMLLGKENGIECIRQIKKLSPDTHCVLMSAYPDREFRRLGFEVGAVAFIDKKDIDIATLEQIIADADHD